MANRILPYTSFGDPRKLAARDPFQPDAETHPHGLSPRDSQKIHDWLTSFEPRLISAGKTTHNIVDEILPEAVPGATLDPRAGSFRRQGQVSGLSPATQMGSSTFVTAQRPYQPEFSTQARSSFPIHRILASRYWTLFYKVDPFTATCINMLADLVFSDFQLSGPGVDGEIKQQLDKMVEATQLRANLPWLPKMYMVLGEVCPHTFWDEDEKIWSRITFLNPDQLEVVGSPFILQEPICEFIPDDRLRQVISSSHPMLRKVREMMPPDLVARLSSRQNIPLSPVNFTFIPRKLTPWDVRGTSMLSVLWQTYMIEDALANSLIATATRASRPLKVVKLGDPNGNYIPSPDVERRMMQLLAQAELDPECFPLSTPVTLFDGTTRPIGKLKPGAIVIDRNGQPAEVQVVRRETSPSLTRIGIVGDEFIECTPNHQWPILGGPRTCMCGCGEKLAHGNFRPGHGLTGLGSKNEYWRIPNAPKKIKNGAIKFRFLKGFNPTQKVKASELRKGDFLKIPRKFKELRPEGVSPDMARLLGYYAAEGTILHVYKRQDGSERLGFSLALCTDEVETFAKDAQEIVQKYCGYTPKIYYPKNTEGIVVSSHCNAGSELADWLRRHAGVYSQIKQLSPEVMAWPLDLKYEFLKGYIGGDGYQTKIKNLDGLRYMGAGSSSLQLIRQVKLIIAQLGHHATFHAGVQIESSYGAGNPFYSLQIRGELARKLIWDIWKIRARKRKNANPPWWVDDDFLYIPIRSVETVTKANGKPFDVVNMTVSGDHSYAVNGFGTYNSWIATNYATNFELFGEPQRALNLSNQLDFITKIKLIAFGISESFLSGDSTYSNAAAGLTVMMQRLLSLRELFESEWLYPKYFRQVSEMNEWVKPREAEISGPGPWVRTKRAASDKPEYIVPTIEWERSLDPSANNERLQALATLETQLGVKLSKRTKLATVGLDLSDELQQIKREVSLSKKLVGKDIEVAAAAGVTIPGMAPPMSPEGGGGGGGPIVAPGLPPEALGDTGGGLDVGAPPAGGEAAPPPGGDVVPMAASKSAGEGEEETREPLLKGWQKGVAEGLAKLFKTLDAEVVDNLDDPWPDFFEESPTAREALMMQDREALWQAAEDWMVESGYPTRLITNLQDILRGRQLLRVATPQSNRQLLAIKQQLAEVIQKTGGSGLYTGVRGNKKKS